MTENNNQKDQPTGEQQSSAETETEYRELTDEEKQILEEHKKWLEPDGKEGERSIFNMSIFDRQTLKSQLAKGISSRRQPHRRPRRATDPR